MIVSLEAIFLSTFVLISQNRADAKRQVIANERLGDYFAEVLLLDQASDADRARAELGWGPSHPGLVDEFTGGSYRKVSAAT